MEGRGEWREKKKSDKDREGGDDGWGVEREGRGEGGEKERGWRENTETDGQKRGWREGRRGGERSEKGGNGLSGNGKRVRGRERKEDYDKGEGWRGSEEEEMARTWKLKKGNRGNGEKLALRETRGGKKKWKKK